MKYLGIISCLILPLYGKSMIGQDSRPENPGVLSEESWADLADTLLCAGNTAEEIRDGLRAVWPNNHWFVLVQDSELLWASNKDLSTELHHADDLCGKNLVVWMYSGGIKGCNENVAGTVAQELIDQAVSAFPFPEDILDYIKTNEESYSLTHWFTISWMTGSDLSSSTAQSCKVENSQAWYLIKTGPSQTEAHESQN